MLYYVYSKGKAVDGMDNVTQEAKEHLRRLTEGTDVYFGGRTVERNGRYEVVLSVFNLEDNKNLGSVTLEQFDVADRREMLQLVQKLKVECEVYFGDFKA